jgi:5-methylcytosine-specific restriction endonuclease McrA
VARAVSADLLAPAQVRPDENQVAPAQVERPRTELPSLPERYLIQVAISKATHDKLRRAQELLSHAVPSGDVAQVLDRALEALIAQLEKRKFGAAEPRSRRKSRPAAGRATRKALATRPRHVSAQVRRAVWERDQGQCTFVSGSGRRCETRKFLEYDHVEPVARGGAATVEGMRLRCRAHNQYEAERVFGEGFMSRKREEAVRLRARSRGGKPTGPLQPTASAGVARPG